MSAILAPPSKTSAPPAPAYGPRRWTCQEFHRLGDLGVFEGESVILVDGEILQMPPPNPPHDAAVALCEAAVRAIFAAGYWVRGQISLVLSRNGDPVPDVAVVTGSPRDYTSQKPTMAMLVVEVSESSLPYDQGEKASMYAAAGIADYWSIDLVNRQLEVRRRPAPDASQPHGHRYADLSILRPGDSIAPLAAPQSPVAVADLLP